MQLALKPSLVVSKKTSAAYKYITNAHSKKIYSLDWCSSEEILLSSSRDGTIKLWNPNMIHQKFMQIRLDFPNWKAKFTVSSSSRFDSILA